MFSNIDRPLSVPIPTSSETWSWGLDNEIWIVEKNIWRHEEGSGVLEPSKSMSGRWWNHHASWKTGKLAMEALVPHFSCHTPAMTCLTQVDILQSYRNWHGFVSNVWHHSSLSGWNIEEFLHLIGPCPSHCYMAMKHHEKSSSIKYRLSWP